MGGSITILDGGMGRELMRMGAPFRQPEWSALALMEAPETVARAHAAFAAAGARVLTTNSYALVPFHLGAERFGAEGARLADLAGRLAREVADRHGARVAGSLPPVMGSYRPDLFDAAAARPVLEVLVAALGPHVDLWLGETLSCIAEAELVRACLGAGGKPLWLSFTLTDDPDAPPRLRSGEDVAAAAAAARRLGAAALLFNCSLPEVMGPAIRAARGAAPELPVGAYANAFRPQRTDATANAGLSELRDEVDPAAYLAFARDWAAAGATIIGGCCGIGPEHIAALAAGLRGA
jgi:S-methylmethionine-dependent homocysteine/selenocysteine methylase